MQFNKGPLDLWHILQRRRVSFSRWCEDQNVRTQEAFRAIKVLIEQEGEFFFSKKFNELGLTLPLFSAQVVFKEDELLNPPAQLSEDSSFPVVIEEKDPPKKKKKIPV